MATDKLQGIVGITGLERQAGGFFTSKDRIGRIDIPTSFGPEDLQRAQRDCEILAEKLRDQPGEMASLLEAITHNKFDEAHRMIGQLRLTEQEFSSQGGGLYWLVVVGVLLYATDAY